MSDAARERQFGVMEGRRYKLGRIELVFKRRDAEGRPYSVVESIEPPGAGASLHRHDAFEETFLVCEGRYEFRVGSDVHALGPGDALFVPRGAPHSLVCTSDTAGRLLTISDPPGLFEAFIAEVCAAMVDTGAGSAAPAVDFRAIAARHGIEFLT
jgi:quercetin dioxygenase-like cupin family protein